MKKKRGEWKGRCNTQHDIENVGDIFSYSYKSHLELFSYSSHFSTTRDTREKEDTGSGDGGERNECKGKENVINI